MNYEYYEICQNLKKKSHIEKCNLLFENKNMDEQKLGLDYFNNIESGLL